MPHSTTLPTLAERIEIHGENLPLTDQLRATATEKISRLLRDDDGILRIRVDLQRDPAAAQEGEYIAKGQIELGGPDLLASVASNDPARSLEFLLENFDRQLRRRHSALRRNLPRSKALGSAGPTGA